MTIALAAAEEKPKRRWLRFSLRGLLIITAVVGICFAWLAKIMLHVRHQHAIVAQIESLGGQVLYDYQETERHYSLGVPPPGPRVVRFLFGDDAYAHVQYVRFDDPAKPSDRDLELLGQLPELMDLKLSGPSITDQGIGEVAKIPKLRGLFLANTGVTVDGLKSLGAAKRLKSNGTAGLILVL